MATLPKSLPSVPLQVRSRPAKLPPVPRKGSGSRIPNREPIAAAKAKTHFLKLLDQVELDRTPITITKRGRVVAQIVPAESEVKASALDEMIARTKNMMTITGDIVSADHEEWGPEWR